MKIYDLEITNESLFDDEWWESVQRTPDDPSLEITLEVTVSWNEYQKLMQQANFDQ